MKTWKQWTLVAIVTFFGMVLGFTACDNNGNDPILCNCPNGTTHYADETCCEGTDCNCTVIQHPTANAGTDFEHNITDNGTTIALNGSGANGSYLWACIDTPTGAQMPMLSNTAIANPTVNGFDTLGEYEFKLTVSNGTDSVSDVVKVSLCRTASTTLNIAVNNFSVGTELDFAPSYSSVSNAGDFSTADINSVLTYTLAVVNHDESYTNTWNSADGFGGKVPVIDEYEGTFNFNTFTQTFFHNGQPIGGTRILEVIVYDDKFEYFGEDYSGIGSIPAINGISISRKVTEGSIPQE